MLFVLVMTPVMFDTDIAIRKNYPVMRKNRVGATHKTRKKRTSHKVAVVNANYQTANFPAIQRRLSLASHAKLINLDAKDATSAFFITP